MVKSALEVLKCPQCGGEVDLDDKQEYGFCKYCGARVQNTNFKIIKGEFTIAGNPTVQNYIKLAERYYNDENYKDALDNYNQVLNIEPDNWKAVYRRGVCITKTTNLNEFRIEEIVNGSKNAIKIIEENKIDENLNQIKLDMSYDITVNGYNVFEAAMKHYREYSTLKNSAEEMWNHEYIVLESAVYAAKIAEEIDNDNIRTTKTNEDKVTVLMSSYNLIIKCCNAILPFRSYNVGNKFIRIGVKQDLRIKCAEMNRLYSVKLREIDPKLKNIDANKKIGTPKFLDQKWFWIAVAIVIWIFIILMQ